MAIKTWGIVGSLLISLAVSASEDLQAQYSVPIDKWPTAQTADDAKPAAMGPLLPIGVLPTRAQRELGETLFNDTILSRDKTISCASCHDSALTFQDGKTAAHGIDQHVGTRNTPAIFGIDHWQSFFWDGRAQSATEQALKPIENPIEMDLSIEQAIVRLNASASYRAAFKRAFGREDITSAMLAMALVAFERVIPAPDTKFQRFITRAQADPESAVSLLSTDELKGLHLFRTKAKCMTCHEGPLLSDNEFHVTGFHLYGRRFEDLGRVLYTQHTDDIGKFRTPSLLGVTHTGPWMHNGLFTEFKPMIMQYNAGGFRPKPKGRKAQDPLYPHTTDLIVPLGLSNEELDALVAFLHIL